MTGYRAMRGALLACALSVAAVATVLAQTQSAETPQAASPPAATGQAGAGQGGVQSIADKAAVCAACHGEAGVPINDTIPVIWGQNEGYLYLELRDFKLGHRASDVMGPMAATLERQDMRDLAAYFAAKPWPALRQAAPTPDMVKRAEAENNGLVCTSCHLAQFQGNSTVPHLAGQNLDYLLATMTAFKSGARANNPGMTSMLKTVSDADLAALAHYLAGM